LPGLDERGQAPLPDLFYSNAAFAIMRSALFLRRKILLGIPTTVLRT